MLTKDMHSIVPTGEASYAHLTCVRFSPDAVGRLIYPGHAPLDHYGYVRNTFQKQKSRRVQLGEQMEKLPFRDYPDSFRTQVNKIHQYALSRLETNHAVVVSARNVDNELLFQARIDGQWCRRADDSDVPGSFPVLRLPKNQPLSFCQFDEVCQGDEDLLIGLPLVISARAVSREFIIKNASDIAWLYAVDPEGKFGPPPPAWERLSDRWQQLRDLGCKEVEFADELDRMARLENENGRRLGRRTIDPPFAHSLPHSVLAWRGGAVHAVVSSGALWDIAGFLEAHSFESAFVLDQSGSTQYSLLNGAEKVLPIVGTANWRDSGTCFLAIKTGDWLWSAPHFEL